MGLLKTWTDRSEEAKSALQALVEAGLVLKTNDIYTLSDLPKVKQIIDFRIAPSPDVGNATLAYMAGKFVNIGGKAVMLANSKNKPAIADFLLKNMITELELIDALKFYYETMVEKQNIGGRVYLKGAKSIKTLLEAPEEIVAILRREDDLASFKIISI